MGEIDDNRVALVVAKRRGEPARAGRNKGQPVSPATVNRTATEPLRKLMRRAQKVWKLKVGDVDWSQHMLAEPRERVREASIVEEASVMNELARGYENIIEFTLINALRRMEAIGLEWSRVDFFSREFTVIGKRGKSRTLPMTEKTYQILWRQKNHHPTVVFTYEAARTDKRKNRMEPRHKQCRGQGLTFP